MMLSIYLVHIVSSNSETLFGASINYINHINYITHTPPPYTTLIHRHLLH